MTSRRQRRTKIALDAMGGDHAPAELVAGAVEAVAEFDVDVRLVGDEDTLREELGRHNVEGLPIRVVPSEGYVREGESPALALRQNPRASIIVATGLVKYGLADACVSMGSTGAAMAAAAVVLGMPEGVEKACHRRPRGGFRAADGHHRPGGERGLASRAVVHFRCDGEVFARRFWGIERPRVAVLSVGSEAGKGNNQVKEATELLEKSGLNFIGNVEANELPFGPAEVVVCDGFVGNVVMKLTEGLGQALSGHLRDALGDSLPAGELERLVNEMYELNNIVETWGGGPIFGVNGVSIVGHGRARRTAVKRAISTAKRTVDSQFVSELNEELASVRSRVESPPS